MRRSFYLAFATLGILAASLASGLTSETSSRPRVYRDRVDPHWITFTDRSWAEFWYRVELPDKHQEFVLVDAVHGQRVPAFDHARLAAALSGLLGRTVDAESLPFDSLTFSPDGAKIVLHGADTDWELDRQSYAVSSVARTGDQENNLPPEKAPHPSSITGPSTSIRFVNRLPAAVDLFWLDTEGQRQPYGSLAPGGEYVQHTYAGHVWLAAAKDGSTLVAFEARETPGVAVIGGLASPDGARKRRNGGERRAPARDVSPDGRWETIVHGNDLFLRATNGGAETPLTHDATPASGYAHTEEAARSVGMHYDARDPAQPTPEVYWAPDSRHLVAMRYTRGATREIHLVQSSPRDQLQPKLVSLPYLKAGDDIPYTKPHLFDVVNKQEVPVNDALFANPWMDDEVRWNPDASEFTFQFNQRGHQAFRILGVNAASGAVRAIVDEECRTFFCYSGKFFAEYLDKTDEIIWMSERDGWNHLYLYDAKIGAVKNQITQGAWPVRGVDRVDRENRQVWFHAGGVDPHENPYQVQYYRINFDGTGLTALTAGDGNHTVKYSPDHRYLIDTWSRVDLPTVNELRRVDDGSLVCRLEAADAHETLAAGWQTPEPFVAKGRDGTTDIWGVIIRPRHFDPAKKYPVLEDIYAGPTESYAMVDFADHPYRFQPLADRGFVIVQINGMGTTNRSKAFHDVCWKNLADAGFADRILWIQAAAAKYPALDLRRVGIFGTSAGGQNALRALLDHGDFYRVGVADSGCHDNRMDKIWWNEQWFGWPVDESYARSSNVVDAHKLQGKLLLMVGEMDKNVDPASTMQVVNALIAANKDFEFLDVPNAGHGVVGTAYGMRRLTEFFSHHLLEPDFP